MITYSQSIFFLKFLANRVRRCAKELELNEAVKLAVDECILNNILSEFLRKNKAEVIAMSIFEYDKEEEERKLRKAEYEAGVAAGMKDGMKAGRLNPATDTILLLAACRGGSHLPSDINFLYKTYLLLLRTEDRT